MIVQALLYLAWHSWVNRLRARLQRLRQPRYLVGGIVGGLYFYFYFLSGFLGRARPGGLGQAATAEGRELMVAVILLVITLLAWLIPHARAALLFSEAELAFLFPAPISRRALINYKLLKSQLAILFSSVLLTLFRGLSGGHFLIHALGWWVAISIFNLHLLGSSFAVTMLMDRGISNWKRRVFLLLAVVLAAGGMAWWVRGTLPAFPNLSEHLDPAAIAQYARAVLLSGPLLYLLTPFRQVVAPYFATGTVAFLEALIPALAILGLHYWWVVKSNVAFEEASLEASQRVAERFAAMRSGNWQAASPPRKRKRVPFELKPGGTPVTAIFWKNLISVGQLATKRVLLLSLWIVIVAAFGFPHTLKMSDGGSVVAFVALFLTMMSLISGPQMLRHDLRQDLRMSDLLKTYPMAGWEVVAGELMAPAVILAAVQWLLIVIGVGFFPGSLHGTLVTPGMRLGFGLGLAVVLPCVDWIALLAPNAAALLFPGWVQLGRNAPRGVETMGQQLILMLGQMLVLLLTLLPAGLAGTVVFLAGAHFATVAVGAGGAGLAAALILALEAAVGVWFLGTVFERLDWSECAPE